MFAEQEMKRSLASEACQYVPRQMPVQFSDSEWLGTSASAHNAADESFI
jgi:hypothetical protein